MDKVRCLPLAFACAITACAVYDQSLLGNGRGTEAGDTQPPGGGATAIGGSGTTAGQASAAGGAPANGGTKADGGAPEESSAGSNGDAGDTNVGGSATSGASGGAGTPHGGSSNAGAGAGGTSGRGGSAGTGGRGGSAGASGGGAPVGGAGSGGSSAGSGGSSAGSAGSASVGDALVDNMQHTSATYANAPFVGTWSRVAMGDMVWETTDVASMFHKRADSASDMSLRVAANCPASGSCAVTNNDVELIVTLNNGAAVDLSAYKGLSFYVNRVANTGAILRVAFDDGPSHVGSTSCNGSQLDCGRESEYYVVPTDPYTVSSGTWTKYQMPFASVGKACGWMCTRQNALSVKEIYSIRFRIDRNLSGTSATKIDFELDDLYLYK
ncbi:MAG TPA: hypothetical protein VER11_15650 [Polyangiaceae bacterium]|nr:hypothetical protein [Polyangiaceae bacterium]